MEWADFVHLVRTSEQDSAENSSAYRRSVAAFAALGYAWVVGCAVVALALVAWALPQLLQGRFRFGLVLLLLAAGSLLWVSLRALWVRIAQPEGEEITAEDASMANAAALSRNYCVDARSRGEAARMAAIALA